MALLNVFWTETAATQRNLIFEYWNKRNGSNTYSSKLRLIINNNIGLLRKYPGLGMNTDFGEHRALSLGHFSLVYRYDAKRIIITAFWDNRQDPERLLVLLATKKS